MREVCRQVGFFMLGIFSLLYVVFSRNFAEMRIYVPFLNFPIFVGEILLFICLVLYFFVFDFRSIKGWQWGAVFYFACITLKAIWGYSLWGPLAFRHAALFYYPIFILFGFIFYNKAFLYEPIKIFAVFLILALCATEYFYNYWVLALWVIAFVLMRSFRNRTIKYFFYAGFLVTIFLSYKDLIITSRTFIIGNMAAVVFLVITFLLIAKIRVLHKIVIGGLIFILLVALVFKYSSVNASGTIFNMNGTMKWYRMFDAEIKARHPYYVTRKFKCIKLFNPEQPSSPAPTSDKKPQADTSEKMAGSPDKSIEENKVLAPTSGKKPQADTSVKKGGSSNDDINKSWNNKPITKTRNADSARVNASFRLFIWRDMIFEFSRHWPILGFSFGKPFRSESLEILDWAVNEWQRDGWIEPHNSYLNILYRAGILGVALIGFLIWQFCYMVKSFIALKSSSGISLCSALIVWLAAANFLPILELPYNAISFWALWGVALGYLKELKDKG